MLDRDFLFKSLLVVVFDSIIWAEGIVWTFLSGVPIRAV